MSTCPFGTCSCKFDKQIQKRRMRALLKASQVMVISCDNIPKKPKDIVWYCCRIAVLMGWITLWKNKGWGMHTIWKCNSFLTKFGVYSSAVKSRCSHSHREESVVWMSKTGSWSQPTHSYGWTVQSHFISSCFPDTLLYFLPSGTVRLQDRLHHCPLSC